MKGQVDVPIPPISAAPAHTSTSFPTPVAPQSALAWLELAIGSPMPTAGNVGLRGEGERRRLTKTQQERWVPA